MDKELRKQGFIALTPAAGWWLTDGEIVSDAVFTPQGLEDRWREVDYDGAGDGAVVVSADECVGLDRTGVATFSAAGCADVERTVFQLGLREEFTDRDFLVADGGTFHVIKQQYYGIQQ